MGDGEYLIHLVHHDSNVLLALYDVLSAAGFRVAASSNALDGLAYIARSKPRAVLCHWEMPEINGAELVERLKHSSPASRVVVSSPQADAAMYGEVRAAGGDDLLAEPFNPLAVVHAVSRMLGFSVPYLATDPAATYDLDSGAVGRRWDL